jgi:hypothetical protein
MSKAYYTTIETTAEPCTFFIYQRGAFPFLKQQLDPNQTSRFLEAESED